MTINSTKNYYCETCNKLICILSIGDSVEVKTNPPKKMLIVRAVKAWWIDNPDESTSIRERHIIKHEDNEYDELHFCNGKCFGTWIINKVEALEK